MTKLFEKQKGGRFLGHSVVTFQIAGFLLDITVKCHMVRKILFGSLGVSLLINKTNWVVNLSETIISPTVCPSVSDVQQQLITYSVASVCLSVSV